MSAVLSTFICVSFAQCQGAEVLVAAASDLAGLKAELISEFQKESKHKIIFTFSASGQLALQIEQGAPFDLFLSANEEFVERLSKRHLIEPLSLAMFARGRLGLWAPGRAISEFEDLTRPEYRHIAIANPVHAPYGMAAKKALETAGVYKKISSRLVYGENVRQALQFGETGNADAVIVSWSLLKTKAGAVIVPLGLHDEIRQTLGVVKGSKNEAAAREFARWLLGPKAKAVFLRAGFY